ncbi:MAG: MBL fold metallo-hydrolase [Elusimicrobiales bacterium]|nr:MBL fold metallo-hydrolase [Elusimicrobiales bacterium]
MKKYLACFAILLLGASSAKAQLSAYFINVGQGDATYIELPNGGNVLIDGGPSGTPVYEFLKAKGVTKIDHVVLTHPHSDHYRGLKKVFAAFDVKNYYDTRAENKDAQGDNNLRELASLEPSCRTHYPEAGQNLDWDKHVTVKVLNTCSEPLLSSNNDEINNCSIVLRFYYNGHGILTTGDAEASVENAMMRIFKSGLQSTYLKVSHHGSRYSSTDKFLARVQPRVAIISVGLDNNYGHPHKEALDRLTAAGAQIFNTLSGTQSLVIPAPKRGVELMINDQIDLPVTYTPAPKFIMTDNLRDPADSAAMRQLLLEATPE